MALAAPSAALNFVQAVVTTQQPASYVFNPERFTEVTGKFWKLSTVVDQASLQSRSANPTAIGHFVFDEVTAAWKRGSPTPHAAAKVRVEIDRNSYKIWGRTREMRTPIQAGSFPDSRAQVCMIPPNMVEAMGGS